MKKVSICTWVVLIALMFIVPLAIAEDDSQSALDSPIMVENSVNESQLDGNIESDIEEVIEVESPFFTINVDAELDSYAPQNIVDQVRDGDIEADTILAKLNELYNPDIDMVTSEDLDDSWVLIDGDTSLVAGDILVTEDFSQVGILLADEDVYNLNDGDLHSPAAYVYYNLPLHEVNIVAAMAQEEETAGPAIGSNDDLQTAEPVIEEPVIEEPVIEEPAVDEIAPAAETTVDPTIEQPVEIPAQDSSTIIDPALAAPIVPPAPILPYFSVVLSDEDFLNYSPLQVSEQIENGSIQGTNIIEQLQGLYTQGIEVVASDSPDGGWEPIGDDTWFILADILVNADFSKVGIWINKDQVFCLNDQIVYAPSEFSYYNSAFQSKTIQEVW